MVLRPLLYVHHRILLHSSEHRAAGWRPVFTLWQIDTRCFLFKHRKIYILEIRFVKCLLKIKISKCYSSILLLVSFFAPMLGNSRNKLAKLFLYHLLSQFFVNKPSFPILERGKVSEASCKSQMVDFEEVSDFLLMFTLIDILHTMKGNI